MHSYNPVVSCERGKWVLRLARSISVFSGKLALSRDLIRRTVIRREGPYPPVDKRAL